MASKRSLQKALAALRQAIDDSLCERSALPSNTRLEADRIVVSLQLSLEEQASADGTSQLVWVVPEGRAPSGQPGHTVTFEFKSTKITPEQTLNRPTHTARPAATPAVPRQVEVSEAELVVTMLTLLFGPPGFDSSARATVFREALEGLGEDKVAAALRDLDSKSSAEPDHAYKSVRHLMRGVIKSGPLRSVERGVEILDELLRQHRIGPVLQLIQDRWKTQQDWADNAPAK